VVGAKKPAFPQSTGIEATSIDFGCKFIEQWSAILGTILAKLLK